MFNKLFCQSLGRKHKPIHQIRRFSDFPTKLFKKDPNNVLITTPIFYVNASPHLGHAYTVVLADSLARWFRLKGKNVLFSTGTDEHGLKIQQAAQQSGLSCIEHCDKHSQQFKILFDALNISYNDFIRTTEPRHKEAVLHFWNLLLSNNKLVEGTYSGWYCTSDEEFLTDEEIEITIDPSNNTEKRISKFSGKEVEWVEERNIKFPLLDYKDQLYEWITKSKSPVLIPEDRSKEIEKEISDIAISLSVSRKSDRVKWGIKCPTNCDQTIYVWLDALVNYLTVTGYPSNPDWSKFWPPDYHIIGKDITRFHSIYWPAFLLAAGEELPQKIIAHAHWTVNRKKMSKSLGNVINPLDLISGANSITVDEFRYFLLREGGIVDDGDFNLEQLYNRITSELSNQYGNLIARSLSPAINPSHLYPSNESLISLDESEKNIITQIDLLLPEVQRYFEVADFQNGIMQITAMIRLVNQYFTDMQPWKLIKTNPSAVTKVLYLIFESIRICAILLQPIIPTSTERMLNHFNIPVEERTIEYASLGKSNATLCNKPISSEKLILFPSRIKSPK